LSKLNHAIVGHIERLLHKAAVAHLQTISARIIVQLSIGHLNCNISHVISEWKQGCECIQYNSIITCTQCTHQGLILHCDTEIKRIPYYSIIIYNCH